MQRAFIGVALTLTMLLAAPAAHAARFGIADDAGKYAENPASFYRQLRGLGMTENRIRVDWNPDRPRTIVEKSFLDRALPAARAQGVKVVFHVYALNPTALTASPGAADEFAAFLELLARTYPRCGTTWWATSRTSRGSGSPSSLRPVAEQPPRATSSCSRARTTG